MGALCLYLSVTIPNLRLLSDPTNENYVWSSALSTQRQSWQENYETGKTQTPPPTGAMLEEERFSVLQTVGAANTLAIFLLAGVVLLQGTEWYLDGQERKDKAALKEKQVQQLLDQARAAKGSKKDQ